MMQLGGRSDGETMLGVSSVRVPAKRVIPVILKIIELFKQNKKPEDDLKSWIHRVSHPLSSTNDSEVGCIKPFFLFSY